MIVSSFEDVEARELLTNVPFLAGWRALYAACPWATEYQSIDFLATWFRVFAGRYTPLCIEARGEDGQLAGLLWLAKDNRTNMVHCAGHAQCEYHGWLARPDARDRFIDAALRHYCERPGASPLTFQLLLPDAPLDWARAPSHWARLVLSERFVRPLLELEKLHLVRKAVAKNTKGRFDRLQELGKLEFLSMDSPGQLEAYWPEIARQYDQRVAGRVSFVKDRIYGEFFFELMRRDPRLLHAFALLLDGKPIATTVAHRCRDSAVLAILPFDEQYARFSPSKLLILKAAEAARKLGYRTLDLTPYGDWKLLFATSTETVETLTIFPSRRAALIGLTKRKLRRIAARGLDDLGIEPATLRRLMRQKRRFTALKRGRIAGVQSPNTQVERREIAARRDHRALGRRMALFHVQEEATGQVFWHPNGHTLYRTLESYIRRKLTRAGYQEVKSPLLLDRTLWEASGHWEKFREHMFIAESVEGVESAPRHLAVKPMNCPGHVQIYKQGLKSYRDLPLRMAEFGACHRNEPSGALYGLMRLRAFVQDDAHIFCTESQIRPEAEQFTKLLFEVYRELGFQDVAVKLSTRPERRVGSDAIWDKAEMALGRACETMGLFYALNQGEGAFYGPKLEFVLRDAIGRDWQCGTLQVDFNMPGRLGASFVDENGEKQAPVMLHRAILGSVERFIGILIEHYEGRLPLWLAPVQLVVATVTAEVDAYARRVAEALQAGGLRVETDLRNRTIRYKVRKHSLAKVPLLVVVGAREAAHGTVSLRRLGSDALETLVLEACVPMLVAEALPPDLRQNG